MIGHSDSNEDEDLGALHVTYANNHWHNINSRGPSVRFGVVHIVNNYYDSLIDSAINSRMDAQVLVQSTAFINTPNAIFSRDSKYTGYAIVDDVEFGSSENTVPEGTLTPEALPYSIPVLGSDSVASRIPESAGSIL